MRNYSAYVQEGYNPNHASINVVDTNFVEFSVADYWPDFIMDQLGAYPFPCKLNAMRAAAMSTCDGSDGVIDGVISDPDICHFDAMALIGATINCNDTGLPLQITSTAVTTTQAV